MANTVTRTEAVRDGMLIDISEVAGEAGLIYPVALTWAVWEDCVAWSDHDNARKGTEQDESGRLWDVVTVLAHAARRAAPDAQQVAVVLIRTPREGRGRAPYKVTLTAIVGLGDDGEPVITVLHPDEY
jgi:hypothetical protein